MTRRGLELYLSKVEEETRARAASTDGWTFPKVDCGGILVPLEQLHDIAADEETMRSLPR